MIFVRPADGAVYVFWLKGTVAEKRYEIYGPRPVPTVVMEQIAQNLNVSWGHVARFTVHGEVLDIDLAQAVDLH